MGAQPAMLKMKATSFRNAKPSNLSTDDTNLPYGYNVADVFLQSVSFATSVDEFPKPGNQLQRSVFEL